MGGGEAARKAHRTDVGPFKRKISPPAPSGVMVSKNSVKTVYENYWITNEAGDDGEDDDDDNDPERVMYGPALGECVTKLLCGTTVKENPTPNNTFSLH